MRDALVAAALLASLAAGSTARAQEVAPGGGVDAPAPAPGPSLTPPELEEYVSAPYPPEALEQRIEGQVVARLAIDEGGLVTEVEILEPAGHGFDEAAAEAMGRFVFSPATRDGVPIPSQVIYRYTFFLEEQEVVEEGPPPAAILTGMVTDMAGRPLEGASVVAVRVDAIPEEAGEPFEGADAGAEPGEDIPAPAAADAEGRFALESLAPGAYQVDVVVPGYKPVSAVEDLAAGETREVTYRLQEESALYETVVRGRRPPREVTRREITRREITLIPGTGGDALRSLQNLPGMARAPFLSGALIVRGSSPGDSQYLLDDLPVPMLYHFGGGSSVVNSDLLERIDFYPGNYSVRYEGATGGIVDVALKKPDTKKIHAYLDADVWDIGALLEVPIGEDWSVAATARRSWIDAILNAALPENAGFEFTVAPRYWDYQAIADYHPSRSDNLRLLVYGSDDEMVFLFGEEVAGNPNMGGRVDFSVFFHRLQVRWDHRFSEDLSNELNIGSGYDGSDSNFGEIFEYTLDEVPLYLRDELAWEPGELLALRTGLDVAVEWDRWAARSFSDFSSEGDPGDPLTANSEIYETEDDDVFYRPGWYGELELIAIPQLRMIYGMRLDYHSQLQKISLDPRFTARYQIVKGTTLKGGIGRFHQVPEFFEYDEDTGNPDIDLIWAVHYGLGVEQELFDRLHIGLEGFYKDLHNLVVSSERSVERGGEMVRENYCNDGTGEVYGLELLVKYPPDSFFFGWITYTLMHSSRIDHPGADERLFDYDQTHILTVVASAILGRGWTAGIRFRLVSGNPITPVVGSVYDADSDIYWPIYGEVNSQRLPLFHQLDVRVDKKWDWKYLKASVYLDVQNVYNQQNVEGYRYSYDYSQRKYFYGLGILPSLGLKLEY